MNLKKTVTSVALAGLLGLTGAASVACEQGKSNPDAFEVQIVSAGFGTEMWEYVLELFEKDHPDVEVIPYMDGNANQQLAARWRQGDPPDFVFLEGDGIDRDLWLENDLLYDCTEWLETATVNGSDERIIDVVGSQFFNRYTNKSGTEITYGLSLLKNSYGVWYDENWIQSNNLSVPENYDALMSFGQSVRSLKADDGTTAVSALCYPGQFAGYLVQGFILPAIAAYNDSDYFYKIINASDPAAFVDQRTVDVMQRFMDFVAAGNVMDGTLSLNHTESQFRWLRHDAALIPNGLWLRNELERDVLDPDSTGYDSEDAGRFEQTRMRYGASPLITADQKPTLITTTVDCGIAAQGDQIELAKEFVTYLYREDVAKMFAIHAETPSVVDVTFTDEDEVSDTFKYTQEILGSDEYLQIYKTGSWGAVDGEFNQIVNEIVQAGANQTTTALAYCQRLQTKAKQQL